MENVRDAVVDPAVITWFIHGTFMELLMVHFLVLVPSRAC